MIEMIEIVHLNEAWQQYTKARGNCHGSLNVVVATNVMTITLLALCCRVPHCRHCTLTHLVTTEHFLPSTEIH